VACFDTDVRRAGLPGRWTPENGLTRQSLL
jgi:hypothetical protein